jgi:hypothetical protein
MSHTADGTSRRRRRKRRGVVLWLFIKKVLDDMKNGSIRDPTRDFSASRRFGSFVINGRHTARRRKKKKEEEEATLLLDGRRLAYINKYKYIYPYTTTIGRV